MPIQVTCPGCYSRFAVSDKYAGKKGPCPKCKKEILIPELKDEVVIHAPENLGPKDSSGRPVLKPLRRIDTTLRLPVIIGCIVGSLATIGIAIAVRLSFESPPTALLAIGALLLAPPLVFAGYQFLRSDELGGFIGKELWLRTGICSLIFPATWGLYYLLGRYFNHKTMGDIGVGEMVVFLGLMIAAGTVASLATMELEAGQALLHYFLYFLISFVLCSIVGVALGEPFAKSKPKITNSKPSIQTTLPTATPALTK